EGGIVTRPWPALTLNGERAVNPVRAAGVSSPVILCHATWPTERPPRRSYEPDLCCANVQRKEGERNDRWGLSTDRWGPPLAASDGFRQIRCDAEGRGVPTGSVQGRGRGQSSAGGMGEKH